MKLNGVLLLALAACGCSGVSENRSLVLVTLDTTRADRIGAFGGTAVPTPNLDRLAREGTIALGATSQVPLTLPSHASILTGRYPASHGVHHNGIYRLRGDEETIAEHLAASGFDTAGFVASYVLNRGFGTEQGFDVYDDVEVNRYALGRDQVFEAQRTAASGFFSGCTTTTRTSPTTRPKSGAARSKATATTARSPTSTPV